MGAIFFYVFIYFIGYYGSSIFNMLTVRPLVTNRFMAALVPVVAVAIAHGYMIVTRPPPASQDITVESAMFTYVIMPVIIVTLGAIYFMWNTRRSEEEAAEKAQEAARMHAEDAEENEWEAKTEFADSTITKKNDSADAALAEESDQPSGHNEKQEDNK